MRHKILFYTLLLLATLSALTVLSLPDNKLRIIACDVGQGDGFLILYKNSQILVDGGPGKEIIDCISENIPFWDRKIEIVVLTHPQLDHYGGLVEVFRRYKVETLLTTPVENSSQSYQVLKKEVGVSGARVINPTSGMGIKLGLIYLDIVWPNPSLVPIEKKNKEGGVLGIFDTKKDLNDFSIVFNLRFGEFDALFTGDIGQAMIEEILTTQMIKDVEYIKIPHHGSRNGLTPKLLEISSPEVAVISSGSENRYGHPHKEILNMLLEQNIRIYRTDERGEVRVTTDGSVWWVN